MISQVVKIGLKILSCFQYLNDRVSMFMHAYTLYSAVRPFGCSAIIGSYDKVDGPSMFVIDSSGVSHVNIFGPHEF